MIKAVVLDVANTLLTKRGLFNIIYETIPVGLRKISKAEIKIRHKLLSEVIKFPDKTSQDFYLFFNKELLRICGVPDFSGEISELIYKRCSYLEWTPYCDVVAMESLTLPLYIISNFNTELPALIEKKLSNLDFQGIITSEIVGYAKPDLEIFNYFMNHYSYTANEFVYVGDSIKLDCEPASRLGIKSFLIDRENIYESYPDRLSSFYELKANI